MTRARPASVLVAAVAVAAAVLTPAGQARAATPPSRQGVMVLAASDDTLVFARGSAATDDEAVPGALYFRVRHGRVHRLATSTDVRWASADIAGSMVVYQPDATHPTMLAWRDLSTGAVGTLPSTQTIVVTGGAPATASYRAPAPGGWILEAAIRGADHLYLQTPRGALTDLGAPNPAGDSTDEHGLPVIDDDLRVTTSRTTLLVTASADEERYTNGSASLMSFAKPGRFTRFIGPGHAPSCRSLTSRFLACTVDGTQRLYAVDGRLVVSSTRHGEATVAGDALAIQNRRKRGAQPSITLVAADGTTRQVAARMSARGRSGLGGVIVTRGRGVWAPPELALLTSKGTVHTLIDVG